MSDAPVSSSAHARKVQILVWSGTASITVVQTLLALIAYLKLEGGSTVVPGLDRWQVMYAGHVLISLTCLLLLIPVLRGPRPSLSILIVVLGFIPTWPQVAAYVAATVIGMRKGAKAIPAVVAAMVIGVAMSPLLNPIPEEATLSSVATYAVAILPICIVCVMLGVNLQAREELLRSASREARLIRTTQEARIAQSRAEERARIFREMHDSLAHRLSLVSLHAGALQTRTDLDMGSVRRIAGSIHTLAAALRAGATGFLLKDSAPELIFRSVHAAANGQRAFSGSVLDRLVEAAVEATPQRRAFPETVTERERQVALLVAQGLGNSEIAAELAVGASTVKTHVSALLDKFGVTNRVQLAVAVAECAVDAAAR